MCKIRCWEFAGRRVFMGRRKVCVRRIFWLRSDACESWPQFPVAAVCDRRVSVCGAHPALAGALQWRALARRGGWVVGLLTFLLGKLVLVVGFFVFLTNLNKIC